MRLKVDISSIFNKLMRLVHFEVLGRGGDKVFLEKKMQIMICTLQSITNFAQR